MTGRKPIYPTDTIKVGKRIEVEGKTALYKDQFVYALNKHKKPKRFKSIVKDGKVFIERIK